MKKVKVPSRLIIRLFVISLFVILSACGLVTPRGSGTSSVGLSLPLRFRTAGEILSSPVIYSDVIYFGSYDGYV